MLFEEAVKGKTFKCDSCHETFKGEHIVLKPMHSNISMENRMLTFKFVDQRGNIMGGSKGPGEGDQVAHCPKCDRPHLFGFNEVS